MTVELLENIVKVMPKLLEKTKGELAPVLRFAKERGVGEEGLKRITDIAMPLSADALTKSYGLSRPAAMKRLFGQAAEELDLMPKELIPKPGSKFELTKPFLPAEVPPLEPAFKLKPGQRPMAPLRGAFKLMNPAYQAEHVFGPNANMAHDVADATAQIHGNTSLWMKRLKMYTKGLADPRKDQEFVDDMVKGFQLTLKDSQAVEKLQAERNKIAQYLEKTQTTGKKMVKWEPMLQEIDTAIGKHMGRIQLVNQPLMQKWAERSGSVRIMLALEDDTYPWVTKMLHPNEREAAKAIRQSLDLVKGRADELGIGVITKGKYAPHYTGRLIRELERRAPEAAQQAKFLSVPQQLRWAQRSAGSVQWWPVPQTLPRYYATAHRYLAYTPVLQKWNPVLKKMPELGLKAESESFGNWLTDLAYGDKNEQRLIDRLVGLEYMDKVGLSPSTAFKHLMKASVSFAYEPTYFSKGALSSFKESGRWMLRKVGVPLAKYGIDSNEYDRFARYYLQSRALFRGFSGIEPGAGMGGYILRNTLAQPTATVEAFERFANVTGMLMKGMNKDVTMGRTMQQMWSMMIDTSFVGQIDRYSWLKSPLQRLIWLFYYTPTRIVERTARLFAYTAFPERVVGEMKNNVLQTAARMRRDPLGGTYAGKLARAALVVGGLELYARQHDTSIWQWAAFHLPWLRATRTGDPEVVLPPPVDLANRLNQLGWTRDAFIASVLNHYGAYTIQKMVRMTDPRNLIPDIYKGPMSSEQEQRMRYWFGLPSLSAIERIKADKLWATQKAREKKLERMSERNRWFWMVFGGFKNFLQHMGNWTTVPDRDPEEPREEQ